MADPLVVEAVDVRKAYGGVETLRGRTLQVPRGSIFGLLGRNGATDRRGREVAEGHTRVLLSVLASPRWVPRPNENR